MSLLYLVARVCLFLLHFGVRWRVRAAERRYDAAESAAEAAAKEFLSPPGPVDPDRLNLSVRALTGARQQARMAAAAERADRAECCFVRWTGRSERLKNLREGMARYAGRTLPYVAGKIDAAVTCGAAEYYGWGPLTLLFTATEYLSQINLPF